MEAYLIDKNTFFSDNETPLVINSCGNPIYPVDEKRKPNYKPNGRPDYQVIYIVRGKGTFYFEDGVSQELSAGDLALYRPLETQYYLYTPDEETAVYWIHFTGKCVEELLINNLFHVNQHYVHVGVYYKLETICQDIVKELYNKNTDYNQILSLLLQQFFILSKRFMHANVPKGYTQQMMEHAGNYFYEHYNQEINIRCYAISQNMSISSFINNFKAYYGKTPLEYIINLRINVAQSLLENDSLSISEISTLVGYDNNMYFCKLFKQRIGITPSDYRKRTKK